MFAFDPVTQEEEPIETTTGTKRKRMPTGGTMSKNKKPNSECTNAQLMSTLDKLAEKMNELPNRSDLKGVETELTNRMHLNAQKFERKIQDNTREIRAVNSRLDKQEETVARLERELEKRKKDGYQSVLSIAQTRRNEAQEEKYLRARRSFRIWPVHVKEDEQPEVCVRRFFILQMKVPAVLAREANIEQIRRATPGHQRSRIHDEYVVTFERIEERDAVKSYANGLASSQGKAGLRLELPDNLKGSYRTLEEHGLAVRELYGEGTKRSVKFDDRAKDLMMDVKLPGSLKWHNVTVDQARKAKRMREEAELTKLSQGKTIAGPAADRERAKVLMLVYTPEKSSQNLIATGANLIDIESSFHNNGTNAGGRHGTGVVDEVDEAEEAEEEQEQSVDDSDESMSRLLHGRNHYQ